MKTHQLKFNDDDWKGTVTVKVPKVAERFKMMGALGLKINSDGEVDSQSINMLSAITELIPMIPDFVEKVDLKHKDGEEIKELEPLEYYQEGMPVLAKIGMFLMQGASLSKNSKGQ